MPVVMMTLTGGDDGIRIAYRHAEPIISAQHVIGQ